MKTAELHWYIQDDNIKMTAPAMTNAVQVT
jgi:hypothetical protein